MAQGSTTAERPNADATPRDETTKRREPTVQSFSKTPQGRPPKDAVPLEEDPAEMHRLAIEAEEKLNGPPVEHVVRLDAYGNTVWSPR